MLSIGWVIFWKCVVLWVWADIQDFRKARKEGTKPEGIGVLLYEEWKRRTAKQPPALLDLRSEHAEEFGPVHEDFER
jgi:hypothetical protein